MSGRRSASPERSHHRSRHDREDRDRNRDREYDHDKRDRREKEKDRSSKHDKRDRGRDRDDREKDRERDRDASPALERTIDSLAQVGAKELDVESDYFLKAAEFRIWLKEEKGKYFDELSGESSRKYFKKFVKRWNNLTLPKQYYASQPSTAAPSSSLTGYKWSFANNRSRVDKDELSRIREDVDRMTHAGQAGSSAASGPSTGGRMMGPSAGPNGTSGRVMGPAFPPSTMFSANHTDRQLALEDQRDASSAQRKADRQREYEKANEAAPKSGGREGKMEEKRATNAENRQYRDRDAAAGMEVDDATLMGADGGFAAAKAKRDAADAKRQQNRAAWQNDKRAATGDRFSEIKTKDEATMAMFQQMAKARYGG